MKAILAVALCLGLVACQKGTQDTSKLTTQKDSVSYCIGMDIGKNLKSQSVEVTPEILARGIQDVLDSSKKVLTEEQAQKVMIEFQKQLMAKQNEKMKVVGEKNKKDGEAFLIENKKKEGVVTLPSGLQYKILTAGTGKKPKLDETVTVNYRGTLIDGTEFDSSIKRGQPATFPCHGVIKGWTEALQLMPVGSKWQLFVPSELAYGAQGAGGVIGPDATLIFEIELLSSSK
jgi:FKBP-type peptidyl-prolyl cis-trans isomerase FklB